MLATGSTMTAWEQLSRDFREKIKGNGAAPPTGPLLKLTHDINPAVREYSWPPFLPKGGLLTLAGRGGCLKSTTAIALCSYASRAIWPDGYRIDEPINSLVCEWQESEQDIKAKLVANSYKPDHVFVWTQQRAPAYEELETLIVEYALGIVVMSPGRKYVMAQGVQNENNDAEVEPVLDRLQELGKRLKCLIILIKHHNKKPDLSSPDRIAGASAYHNSARTVLQMAKIEEYVSLLETTKPQESKAMRWRIRSEDVGEMKTEREPTAFVKVHFEEPEEGDSIDKALSGAGKKAAGVWLFEFLKERGGMAQAKVILEAARAAGYAEDAIKRAKLRDTRILSVKHGFQGESWWKLSDLSPSSKVDGL